jgi:hypothetical protein
LRIGSLRGLRLLGGRALLRQLLFLHAALIGQLLFFDLLVSDDARVFRHLRRFAGVRLHGLPP